MVNDDLLTRSTLDTDEWRITPEPDTLIPDSVKRKQRSDQFRDALRPNDPNMIDPSAVVITHGDADGLTSAALLTDLHGRHTAVRPVSYHGAYQFKHALADLIESNIADRPVYICDFNPPDYGNSNVPDDLRQLIGQRGCSVTWYDHHQWAEDAFNAHMGAGIDVVLNEDECTASIIQSDLDHEFADRVDELVDVTRDIDLWIRDDPRSPRLNTFAELVDTPAEYVLTVLEHGPDLPADVSDRIDDQIARDSRLEQAAVKHADVHTVAGIPIATTYTRGGRSSEIGNTLVESDPFGRDIDIAIILRAAGSVGIYSHSDGQGDDPDSSVFARCHEIAGRLGGGGHPTASGFSVPVETFRDLARYWATAGESVVDLILTESEHVLRDETSDGNGDDEANDTGAR